MNNDAHVTCRKFKQIRKDGGLWQKTDVFIGSSYHNSHNKSVLLDENRELERL